MITLAIIIGGLHLTGLCIGYLIGYSGGRKAERRMWLEWVRDTVRGVNRA